MAAKNRPRRSLGHRKLSIVCSGQDRSLAEIREAINEVAAAVRGGSAGEASAEELSARVAQIWAMLAELDPALARRMATYSGEQE
jgi:hypothetical protein